MPTTTIRRGLPAPKRAKDHSLSGLYAQCRYHSTNASDDFLSSPAIHMEAGKEYKVLYGYRTYNTSNKEHMTVYVSPSVADAASITGRCHACRLRRQC